MAMNRVGWAVVAAAGILSGCNSSGGGSATVGPSPSQVAQAQKADAGASSLAVTQDAATSAVVESGAPGSTSAQSGMAPASGTPPASTIDFQGSVSLTVDLDALNASGQDAYPNASGKFSVSATGTVTGTSSAGQVSYSVQITWLTDGVFTDPVSGDVATVASGSSWSYTLSVEWTKTDSQNWSIQASSNTSGSLQATVVHQSTTWTVTGTVDRQASATFSSTAGVLSFTLDVSGQRTVVVTDGTETHTVVTTLASLDSITLEVDGVVFGPFTLAQIRFWFGLDCIG